MLGPQESCLLVVTQTASPKTNSVSKVMKIPLPRFFSVIGVSKSGLRDALRLDILYPLSSNHPELNENPPGCFPAPVLPGSGTRDRRSLDRPLSRENPALLSLTGSRNLLLPDDGLSETTFKSGPTPRA